MTIIDIRDDVGFIDTIKFKDDAYYSASQIHLNESGQKLSIESVDKSTNVTVFAEYIPNLILALQKAVELGWCK